MVKSTKNSRAPADCEPETRDPQKGRSYLTSKVQKPKPCQRKNSGASSPKRARDVLSPVQASPLSRVGDCRASFDSHTRRETLASETPSVCQSRSDPAQRTLARAFLQKVELTPQNNEVSFQGCSFRMAPPQKLPLCPDVVLQRKIKLRTVNSFIDPDGLLLDPSDALTSCLSPYLVAYRRKIKKMRPALSPEVIISAEIPEVVTPQTTFCSCKTSECLKLYCDCFKSLGTCGPSCKCEGCKNRPEEPGARVAALNKTLTSTYGRLCFASVAPGPEAPAEDFSETPQPVDFTNLRKQDLFCRCRKSNCGNKYCSCHSGGKRCGDRCKCSECHNKAGETK